MCKLTKQDLLKLEHYYYWIYHREWVPFPEDLNTKLLEAYGENPIHGLNKIFTKVQERL